MHRRNYASISGIVIDVCRKHGIWLDHSELEKVLDFVRAGGLDRSRMRELERLREERRRLAQGAWAAPSKGELECAPEISAAGELLNWLLGLLLER